MVFHSLAYRVVELAALCSFLCFFRAEQHRWKRHLPPSSDCKPGTLASRSRPRFDHPRRSTHPIGPMVNQSHFLPNTLPFPVVLSCIVICIRKKIEALITNQAALKIPQSKDAVARSIPHCASQVNPGCHGSQIFILKYNHLPTLQCIIYRSYIAVVLKPFSSATNCDCRAELPLKSCSIPSSEKLFLRPRSSWYVSLVERFQ